MILYLRSRYFFCNLKRLSYFGFFFVFSVAAPGDFHLSLFLYIYMEMERCQPHGA